MYASPVRETEIVPDAITDFENDYGNIPDRISWKIVMLYYSSAKLLFAPNNLVDDSRISAHFGLVDYRNALTFGAVFFKLLPHAKNLKLVQSVSDFLEYYFIPLD